MTDGERTNQRRVDRVLDHGFLDDLTGRSVDELRTMKADCEEVETEVSYVRRLAQGRIDILSAERDRREQGGSLGDLVAALPRILAGDSRPAGPARTRLLSILAPSPEISWTRGLESLVNDDTLARLPDLSDDELSQRLDDLRSLESEVSETRHALHQVMDTLERELATRLAS